jgi:hypothetical protein
MPSSTTVVVTARVPHEVAAWLESQPGGLRGILCQLAGVADQPKTGRPPKQ